MTRPPSPASAVVLLLPEEPGAGERPRTDDCVSGVAARPAPGERAAALRRQPGCSFFIYHHCFRSRASRGGERWLVVGFLFGWVLS